MTTGRRNELGIIKADAMFLEAVLIRVMESPKEAVTHERIAMAILGRQRSQRIEIGML